MPQKKRLLKCQSKKDNTSILEWTCQSTLLWLLAFENAYLFPVHLDVSTFKFNFYSNSFYSVPTFRSKFSFIIIITYQLTCLSFSLIELFLSAPGRLLKILGGISIFLGLGVRRTGLGRLCPITVTLGSLLSWTD